MPIIVPQHGAVRSAGDCRQPRPRGCELQAESAEAAIKRAIREQGIDDPHKQKRLAAYRVG
jgi:hypothetical protein